MNSNHRDDSENPVPGRNEMPSCAEVREARLTAYALGELTARERAEVEVECAASPTARRTVEEIRSLADQIRAATRATDVAPSSTLRDAVEFRLNGPLVHRIASEPGALDAEPRSAIHTRRPWQAWAALATAACLLIAAFGLHVAHRSRGGNGAPNELAAGRGETPGGLPVASHPPAEGIGSKAVLVDAGSPAPGLSSGDKAATDGGWRRHNAVPLRSIAAEGSSASPGASRGLPADGTGRAPAKADFASAGSTGSPSKSGSPADSQWTLPRVPLRGTRHQVAASPGFYATVSPEAPVLAVPKKPREPNNPGAGGPKSFGSGETAPKAPNAGTDATATDGVGDVSKLSAAGKTNLALPAGMRPDRANPPGAGKPGKDPKANKKAKVPPHEPLAPSAPNESEADVAVENEFLPAARFPYSAFSLEVDRHAYGYVDRYLRAAHLPLPDRVQVEHLVNYFQYNDPQPAGEVPFAIGIEGAACPWASDHRLVRIAIVGREANALEAKRAGSGGATAATIANDVCVQLQFFPALVESYRLIGYDGPPLSSQKSDGSLPRGVSFSAGETVTALYELVPAKPASPAATDARPPKSQRTPAYDPTAVHPMRLSLIVRLRYQKPRSEEYGFAQVPWTDSGRAFDAASNDFRFASAVAAFGMVLRGSPYCGSITFETVARIADTARGEDPFGQRAEFVDLVGVARRLKAYR